LPSSNPDVRAGDSFPSSIRKWRFLQPSPAHKRPPRTTTGALDASGVAVAAIKPRCLDASGFARSSCKSKYRNRSSAHRNHRAELYGSWDCPSSGRTHAPVLNHAQESMLGGSGFIASIATLIEPSVEFLKTCRHGEAASHLTMVCFQWFSRLLRPNSPSRYVLRYDRIKKFGRQRQRS